MVKALECTIVHGSRLPPRSTTYEDLDPRLTTCPAVTNWSVGIMLNFNYVYIMRLMHRLPLVHHGPVRVHERRSNASTPAIAGLRPLTCC